MSRPNVLVVDHRDSFVFTLVEHIASAGFDVRTLRSDIALEALRDEIESRRPDLVLLSPGPGRPDRAGVMVPFLRTRPSVPVLGVCLGHQAMALAFDGAVGRAPDLVHGRSCVVEHNGDTVFDTVPQRFTAARYHSLTVTEVPACFDVLAQSTGGLGHPPLIMAMRHRELPMLGLQFHPESVLTPFGRRILSNILDHSLTTPELHRQS